MKKSVVLSLVVAAALGGCAMHHHDQHHPGGNVVNHQQPVVSLKYGIVSVSPEPVVFSRSQGDKAITWRLPRDSGLTFDGRGIVIEGQVVDAKGVPIAPDQEARAQPGNRVDREQARAFDCQVGADARQVVCSPNATFKRGIYKYSIRLALNGKALKPVDPDIFGME